MEGKPLRWRCSPRGSSYFAATASAAGPGGWNHLGHGARPRTPALDGAVYALNADKPGLLYVGGNFINAGGHAAADHIASWNGTAWSAVGPKLNGDVHAIAYHAGKVYAGGVFTNAGRQPQRRLPRGLGRLAAGSRSATRPGPTHVRRERRRSADHRLDPLRRRRLPERRRHPRRRLPARVRPQHGRGELDGGPRTATSTAACTR